LASAYLRRGFDVVAAFWWMIFFLAPLSTAEAYSIPVVRPRRPSFFATACLELFVQGLQG